MANKTSYIVVSFVAAMLLSVSTLFAQKAGQECFPKKKDNLMVYDEAQILSQGEFQALEQKLENFVISTSNEIAVVIVPDLCGMERAQFATELGELWQVGQAEEDNGVIVLVKPKTPDSKGEVFIATGRGLEGAIPDATAYLIVENEMIPAFKNKDMAGGIDKAVTVLMELSKGDYNSDAYAERYKNGAKGDTPPVVIIVFVLFIIGLVLLIKSIQVKRYARINNLGFWAAWALLNSMSNTHRGSWNDFNRGRGGFGGFGGGGGGGFGGFGGGGSFGGGGAGGSW